MQDNFEKTAESGNKVTDTIDSGRQEQKTFTQEDVNHIVGERLAKDRSQREAALAERERELTRKEMLMNAKITMKEKGIPVELLEALDASSPEALEKSLSIVEKFHKTEVPKSNELPGLSVPGAGGNPPSDFRAPDQDVRRAMGLV